MRGVDELGVRRFKFIDEGDGPRNIVAGDEAGNRDEIGVNRRRKLQAHQLSEASAAISAIRRRAFAKASSAGMPGPAGDAMFDLGAKRIEPCLTHGILLFEQTEAVTNDFAG